jgi:HsdM N-terminal domain
MLNSATIKSIQDIMRKDAGVDGDAQRLGQLTWLLFLKIFDDREQEWELTIKRYRSPIPEELRWRNWAANSEGLTGEKLLEFVNNKLFTTLKALSSDTSPRHRVIHDVFEDAYQYMKNGTLLRQVINKINESLDFNRSEDRASLEGSVRASSSQRLQPRHQESSRYQCRTHRPRRVARRLPKVNGRPAANPRSIEGRVDKGASAMKGETLGKHGRLHRFRLTSHEI